MTPVALDGTKLLALMVAGGVFALAGLWLMFRPPAEGHAATIKLFGLEFQSSSAGLLVFLIGALFLAVPVFVPEKPQPRAAAGEVPTVGSATSPMPLVVSEGGTEAEPNDHPRGPNLIDMGKVYSGEAPYGDVDYFRVEQDPAMGQLRYVWRMLASRGRTSVAEANPDYRCRLDVLDRNEVRLESTRAPNADGEARSGLIDSQSPGAIYFKVTSDEGSCTYELETRYES